MKHELDFRTQLPIIRAAFDAKELQAQKPLTYGGCLYAGPCAIGVTIPESDRSAFDDKGSHGTSASSMFAYGVFNCPPDQYRDWVSLQQTHDSWTLKDRDGPLYEQMGREFEQLLAKLEAKYLPCSPAS